MRDSDRRALTRVPRAEPAGSTREWLEKADARLRPLLPNAKRPTMTTSRMVDADGHAREVYSFFDRRKAKMASLLGNFWAMQHTAQSVEHATQPLAPPPWPGFEQVWIPVTPRVELAGFLGFACEPDGRVKEADCIILLPGLWGDNGAIRSRDLAESLLACGYHVLSLDPRGHGRTEKRYPDVPYTFSVLETPDLLLVDEWLTGRHREIRRTGLIGFCWGANAALLAAWYDGCDASHESLSDTLRRAMPPPGGKRHFEAGVLAFSPVLAWEDFVDRLDTPQDINVDPMASLFQKAVADHLAYKRRPEVTGSLRACIAYDFAVSELGTAFPIWEGYRFLRFLPYRGLPHGDKLESARVPVMVVHAVNDPLQTAQEVVDLMAQTQNPQVAGYVLPGGGHIGFQAWSRRYFYSLVMSFFDPATGAASAP